MCSLYRCQPTFYSTSTSNKTILVAVRGSQDASLIAIRRENVERVLSNENGTFAVVLSIKIKVSSYIAQYPAPRIV